MAENISPLTTFFTSWDIHLTVKGILFDWLPLEGISSQQGTRYNVHLDLRYLELSISLILNFSLLQWVIGITVISYHNFQNVLFLV